MTACAPQRFGLLIDADNLTGADLDLVFDYLARQSYQLTLRRAYGGHEKLAGMKDMLRRRAVRACINQGKGTTDVALVVDAMDLLHGGSLPPVVGIASSDADFAPLALRLREAGIRALCFAKRQNSSPEPLEIAYDELVFVDELLPPPSDVKASANTQPAQANVNTGSTTEPTSSMLKAKAPTKRATAARKTVAQKTAIPVAPAAPTPAKKTTVKTPAAKKTSSSQASVQQTLPLAVATDSAESATPAVTAEGILQAVPFLQTGLPQHINVVTQALRATRLIGKNASSPTLFRKFPAHFELLPADNPNTVRYILPPPLV